MRRFNREAIVTAVNLGLSTHVATRFLSSKPHNAYHPPRTRSYYDSGRRVRFRT
jgi:hypothetical protein